MVVNCLPTKRKMAEAPNSTPFNILKAPPDVATLVSSLRTVKNQIIGNHHKKIEYRETGLIPIIIGLAEKHSTHAVLLQVSAILYSMAAGGGAESAIAIEAADGAQLLCRLLDMKDADNVVLGATRALKHLYDHPMVSAAPLNQQATHVALVRLAAHPDPVLARYAIQILSVIMRARVAGTSSPNDAVLAHPAHTDFMNALLQQLPRCLYAHPDQRGACKNGAASAAAMDAAGPSLDPGLAVGGEKNSTYVPPKAAPQSFAPLRTTVLTAIDTLLRHHPPSFTPTVCTHLPDIAAAIRYPDAETRMSACALVATLLQPDRRKALQHAAEWSEAREQLFDMFVRGSSTEHATEASEPQARDAIVVSTIELAALTALIKLQALPAMRRQVPLRLLELVGESDRLQRAVADSNALEHLTAFILAVTDNAPWRRRSSTGATVSASNTPTASGIHTGASGASSLSLKTPSGALPEDTETLVTPSEEDTMQLHSALLCVKLLCSCGAPSTLGSVGAERQRKAATPAQCVRNCCAIATPAHLRALACCLRHPSAAVRTSAAQVFQVMGRSTRATTKECFGDSALATTLVDTLSDVSANVQEAICFAICNLCATTSCPARRHLLEKGVIGKLAEISMSCEQHPDVRLPEASLRALANAINNTTLEQRENLMATWPWASVRPLLTQNTTAVCLHTWELLQNLSNSSDEHPVQQAVLKWAQGGLLPLAHSTLADHNGITTEAQSAAAGWPPATQERPSSPSPMDAVDTVRPEGEAVDMQPPPPPPPPVPLPMSHQESSLLTTLLDPPTQPPLNGSASSETLRFQVLRNPEGGAGTIVLDREPRNWTRGATATTDTGITQNPDEGEAPSDATAAEEESQRMRSKVVELVLFVLSNLATGDESVISEVMDSGVPTVLPSYLNYSSGDPHSYGAVRVAACWLVTNLTHVNLSSSDVVEARQQAQQRARTLENCGVLSALQNLLEAGEDIGEVLHRARNALKNFASCHALQQPHDISLDVDEYHREPNWAQ